jgi:hypothetical protein
MSKTGYIYKLAIKDGSIDDCYVGSTSCIKQRKRQHKCSCNSEKDSKHYHLFVYKTIRENGGFENWDLYPLEKVQYDDKIEIQRRERHWVETLKPKLNKQIPTRDQKEWMNDNNEVIKTKKKQYCLDNLDKIKTYRKQSQSCDSCGVSIRKHHMDRHLKTRKHLKNSGKV